MQDYSYAIYISWSESSVIDRLYLISLDGFVKKVERAGWHLLSGYDRERRFIGIAPKELSSLPGEFVTIKGGFSEEAFSEPAHHFMNRAYCAALFRVGSEGLTWLYSFYNCGQFETLNRIQDAFIDADKYGYGPRDHPVAFPPYNGKVLSSSEEMVSALQSLDMFSFLNDFDRL